MCVQDFTIKCINDVLEEIYRPLRCITDVVEVVPVLKTVFSRLNQLLMRTNKSSITIGMQRWCLNYIAETKFDCESIKKLDDDSLSRLYKTYEELQNSVSFLLKKSNLPQCRLNVKADIRHSGCCLVKTINALIGTPTQNEIELRTEVMSKEEIADAIKDCPYSECAICTTTEISENSEIGKFEGCRHLFCMQCLEVYKTLEKSKLLNLSTIEEL